MFDDCPKGGKHNWTEEYYGHRCSKCLQFFAFGCAPWDPDEPEDHDIDDDEHDCGEDTCVCADNDF